MSGTTARRLSAAKLSRDGSAQGADALTINARSLAARALQADELRQQQGDAARAASHCQVTEAPGHQGQAQDAAGRRVSHSPIRRVRSSASCSEEVTASSLSPVTRRVSGRAGIGRSPRTRTTT